MYENCLTWQAEAWGKEVRIAQWFCEDSKLLLAPSRLVHRLDGPSERRLGNSPCGRDSGKKENPYSRDYDGTPHLHEG